MALKVVLLFVVKSGFDSDPKRSQNCIGKSKSLEAGPRTLQEKVLKGQAGARKRCKDL